MQEHRIPFPCQGAVRRNGSPDEIDHDGLLKRILQTCMIKRADLLKSKSFKEI